MTFSDIPAQAEAAARIRSAIDNNRLPHALLICGREGCGALSLARATAQYIMCENRHDGEPCEDCPHCIQAHKLNHPDLHFVFPVVNVGKAGMPSVSTDYMNEWREMMKRNPDLTYSDWVKYTSEEGKNAQIFVSEANQIIKTLSTKPFESDYRVMIIWLPEKINEQAANKLLKIIEEPYEKTHFILVSYDPDHIIGTILSRCQRINLPPLNPNWMQPQFSEEERQFFFTKFCEMMRKSYVRRVFEMRDWSEEMAALGRERQKNFLQYAQALIRENFIMNLSTPDLNYMQPDEEQFSTRFSLYVNHSNVEDIINELALAEGDIQQNANAKIVFFDLSLKFIMLLKKGSENIRK